MSQRFAFLSVVGAAVVCSALVGVLGAGAAESSAHGALSLRHTDRSLQWTACPPIFPSGCEVAVLQGDPAAGRSDVFLRVPAKYSFPPHAHSSAEHMILVAGEMELKYKGLASATLKAGSYAFGPANAPHRAKCGDAGPCVLFIAFESPIDAEPYSGELD